MVDMILRGGTVIDGTGRPRYPADVAITGDRIAAIGRALPKATGAREIDVSGKIVAPGFIDVHTHDDRALFASPDMAAKASQGVTTVVTGNCGISLAPLSLDGRAAAAARSDRRCRRLRLSAVSPITSTRSTSRRRRSTPPASSGIRHCGSARCPNSTGRPDPTRSPRWASGCRRRSMPARSACRPGSIMPRPFHAPPAEIEALAALLRPAGALYTTHMRDEAEHVLDSLDESFAVGRTSGVPVVISHHKTTGVANFGRTAETLPKIAAAMAGRRSASTRIPISPPRPCCGASGSRTR